MSITHEKLDVYRLAIAYAGRVYELSAQLSGNHRHARDPWLRASQSIPLNSAGGNGKTSSADLAAEAILSSESGVRILALQDLVKVINSGGDS